MTAQTTALTSIRKVAPTTPRFQLKHAEEYRLPNAALSIRVIHGIAWITTQSKDLIVHAGEVIDLRRQRFPAVISATSSVPMVFEIYRK